MHSDPVKPKPPQRAETVTEMSRHHISPVRVEAIAYAWRNNSTLTEKGVADNISETPTRVVSAVLRAHEKELRELGALVSGGGMRLRRVA